MGRLSIQSLLIDLALLVAVPVVVTVGMGIYQTVRPEKIMSLTTPKNFGLEYRPVRFDTADGIAVAGWYVPRKSGAEEKAIIVLHGYPADKGDMMARVAFLAEDHDLLLIDFRYFGESGGSYTTVGARETAELLAAVAFLKERGTSSIGVYGFSMGAAVALMALPDISADVKAVAAEASYADLRHMAQQLYRQAGPFRNALASLTGVATRISLGIDIDAVSPAKAVAGATTPVLLIHARRDRVIPFENALRIQEGLQGNPNAEFWFADAGAHGEASVEFATRLKAFFAAHL